MLRQTVIPIVIVIAVVIALISISYPSVVVLNVNTQSLPHFATYTSTYSVGYEEATASTLPAGYSAFTAWYPGNPICDPTSNACTPFPTPTATFVYPQSVTNTYQVTVSSQAFSPYTNEFTSFHTQTSVQSLPPYALAGLTELQYGIIALVIVLVLVLSLLSMFVKRTTSSSGRALNADSRDALRVCQRCGNANPESDKFCTSCGSQLE